MATTMCMSEVLEVPLPKSNSASQTRDQERVGVSWTTRILMIPVEFLDMEGLNQGRVTTSGKLHPVASVEGSEKHAPSPSAIGRILVPLFPRRTPSTSVYHVY